MRAEEIREMADADIRSRLAELEEERFRLKFRSATETLEDPLRLRSIRKDIARLQTVLNEPGREERAAAKTTARKTARKSAGKAATKKTATKRGATKKAAGKTSAAAKKGATRARS